MIVTDAPDKMMDSFLDSVKADSYSRLGAALGDAYYCSSDWGAWESGDMRDCDFHLVVESQDRLDHLVNSVFDAVRRHLLDPYPPHTVEALRETVTTVVDWAIGEAYDCVRVWSAWGVNTMGEDDFIPVNGQSDRLVELSCAILDDDDLRALVSVHEARLLSADSREVSSSRRRTI